MLNLKKKADQDLDRFKVAVMVGAMLIGFVALMAAINNIFDINAYGLINFLGVGIPHWQIIGVWPRANHLIPSFVKLYLDFVKKPWTL